jgi:hypothetical protein
MDPDEALRQLRAAIEAYHAAVGPDADRDANREAAACSMAEHAAALDRWLSAGGFLPTAWVQPAGRVTADRPR